MADQTTESRSTDSKSAVTVPADVPPASKIDAARERLTEAAGRIEERYRQVSGDVRRGAEKASTELRRGAQTAREKGGEAAQQLRQGYGRAREQAQSLNQDLNDYVQEKPGMALLAAAAVGFVVGLLFRRRGGGE
jgi:ElaB/YqjD/DUF883 family membrane-anchored ribosome-binding protein